MYILKQKAVISIDNQRELANKIGIAEETLSRILNRKQGCGKTTAYILTKLNGSEEEVSDYFDIKKDNQTIIGVSCKTKKLLLELSKQLGTDLNKTLEELIIEKLGG